jgi:hypothetical protein
MFRHRGAQHTDDYKQQARACASAALATGIAEIKQAYLELEQGWLCLAAKGGASPVPKAPLSKPKLKAAAASRKRPAASSAAVDCTRITLTAV